ncbi:hypothetical protein AB0F52_15010 [Amycolatopsis sp. NPDC024027]|uniref:hypothetical protein n=1 Tax=Amycolatopsis sp. NPDC024027 TaxID=3154327 RepID=UPI0033ED5C2C
MDHQDVQAAVAHVGHDLLVLAGQLAARPADGYGPRYTPARSGSCVTPVAGAKTSTLGHRLAGVRFVDFRSDAQARPVPPR